MNYVINLNITQEKRKKLNQVVENVADNLIPVLSVGPFIIFVYQILMIFLKKRKVMDAVQLFLGYASPIIIVSLILDKVARLLNLTVMDLVSENYMLSDWKSVFVLKCFREVLPIIGWILVLFLQ